MASFNQSILVGNVGKEPELRKTPNGRSVFRFSLAVDGVKKEEPPMWVTIVAWQGLADHLAKYVHAGSSLMVIGRLSVERYTDKANVERTGVEVVADDVRFLGLKEAKQPVPDEAAAAA